MVNILREIFKKYDYESIKPNPEEIKRAGYKELPPEDTSDAAELLACVMMQRGKWDEAIKVLKYYERKLKIKEDKEFCRAFRRALENYDVVSDGF